VARKFAPLSDIIWFAGHLSCGALVEPNMVNIGLPKSASD